MKSMENKLTFLYLKSFNFRSKFNAPCGCDNKIRLKPARSLNLCISKIRKEKKILPSEITDTSGKKNYLDVNIKITHFFPFLLITVTYSNKED